MYSTHVLLVLVSDYGDTVAAEVDKDGQIHYKLMEDVVFDLLQDPEFQDHIDYAAEPLFRNGRRIFGPFRSGIDWELLEKEHPGKTVVCLWMFTDGTEFYKGRSVEPFYGECTVHGLLL